MFRLILFGANNISLQVAQFAQKHRFDCAIMSNKIQSAAIQEKALKAEIALIVSEHPDNLPLEKWYDAKYPTLAISIGAPWFFDQDFLDKCKDFTFLNLHGTHLPRSRGGTLFSWQIMSGQRTGICLLHQMAIRVDAGSIIDYEEFIYPAHCRKPIDYIQVYDQKNVAFLEQFILKWMTGKLISPIAAQPEYLSTYWPRLRADVHGWLDWTWSTIELERFICAFDAPYGGARCRWRNKEIILRDAWSQSIDGHTHPFQWGIVTRNNGQWLNVSAHGGELILCSVEDVEGRNLIPEIRHGDRLYSSVSDLEAARQRIEKTSQGLTLQPPKL